MNNVDKLKKMFEEDVKKYKNAVIEKIKMFLSIDTPVDVLIIKSQLICDYYLNQIIILKEKCNSKKMYDMHFPDKAGCAFDSESEHEVQIKNSIIELNRLRNKVGHELEYTLSESDIDRVGYTLGSKYIVDKYDIEERDKLLHMVLIEIVINIAMEVFFLVSMKKGNEKDDSPSKS